MKPVGGLHHVTAICGDAQENLDFYAGVLGMRLVKKSVNQDDPGTYHLFYADAAGTPGTDLTFFPWPALAPPRPGYGLATEVSLAVPPATLDFWAARLERFGASFERPETRFGERTLTLRDPHGMAVALVEVDAAPAGSFAPLEDGPVAAEKQIRGLRGARLRERDLAMTDAFLAQTMEFATVGEEGRWRRYRAGGSVLDVEEAPADRRGFWGVGAIHHLAWRVDDEEHQLALRSLVGSVGLRPTPVIDRFWFRSVYFQEPGGVLFELATEGPGFAVDEDPAHLGESLVLPPWLESRRGEIEAALRPLRSPRTGG